MTRRDPGRGPNGQVVGRGVAVLETDCTIAPVLARKAAVRTADWVAAQYPHPRDHVRPRVAGSVTARLPQARADLLEVLAALGLHNLPEEG